MEAEVLVNKLQRVTVEPVCLNISGYGFCLPDLEGSLPHLLAE